MYGPVITLTTDFGTSDPYVGIMKGTILGINPSARVVDLTHQVHPQEIRQAAFLVHKSYPYFPQGSIHVVVVDPGVGTSRRAILLLTPTAAFVAPDNGVLTHVVQDIGGDTKSSLDLGHRLYTLTNSAFWRHPVSNTFHGRDIFAPVAAHLSLGVAPDQLGEPASNMTLLPFSSPTWQGDQLQGQVAHVDRFGNLVTDIEAHLLRGSETALRIEVSEVAIYGLSTSYAQGADLMAIIGSFDTLEIAKRAGNAAAALGAVIGHPVTVSRR